MNVIVRAVLRCLCNITDEDTTLIGILLIRYDTYIDEDNLFDHVSNWNVDLRYLIIGYDHDKDGMNGGTNLLIKFDSNSHIDPRLFKYPNITYPQVHGISDKGWDGILQYAFDYLDGCDKLKYLMNVEYQSEWHQAIIDTIVLPSTVTCGVMNWFCDSNTTEMDQLIFINNIVGSHSDWIGVHVTDNDSLSELDRLSFATSYITEESLNDIPSLQNGKNAVKRGIFGLLIKVHRIFNNNERLYRILRRLLNSRAEDGNLMYQHIWILCHFLPATRLMFEGQWRVIVSVSDKNDDLFDSLTIVTPSPRRTNRESPDGQSLSRHNSIVARASALSSTDVGGTNKEAVVGLLYRSPLIAVLTSLPITVTSPLISTIGD